MERVRRLVPASLTARLTATVVLFVAVVTLLVSLVATLGIRAYVHGQLDSDVRAALSRVRAGSGFNGQFTLRPGLEGGPDDVRGQAVGTLTAYFFADYEPGLGDVLVDSGRGPAGRLALSDEQLTALSDVPADGEAHSVLVPELGSFRVLAVTRGGEESRVLAGLPTDHADQVVGRLLLWDGLLILLGVMVSGGLALIVVRRQLQPLRSVARTAHEVAALPLSSGAVGRTARVPDELTDESTEVGQVGSALNTLLGHMEASLDARHRSEQQVRQFVADASHELRTPLATIQGYAELGLRPSTPPAELEHVLGKVQGESRRMAALVEDLLLLARLDAGRPLAREDVDLSRLVLEAVSDARVVAPGHHWRIDLPEEAVEVPGDAARLHQVLANLLANARRHTPEGTTVTVSLRAATDAVEVAVHDDGPGVPADLQPEVFDRFTRGDASRTRDSGGAGLGLSLARAIAAAHGGTLTLTSVPGDTTFTLALPA